MSNARPRTYLNSVWALTAWGLALGAAAGLVVAWRLVRAQAYGALGLERLAASEMAAGVWSGALWGGACGLALGALAWLWSCTQPRAARWLPWLAFAAVMALAIALPLNAQAWFPGVRTPAGLLANAAIVLAGLVGAGVFLRSSVAGFPHRPFGKGLALALGSLGVVAALGAWIAHQRLPAPPNGAPNVVVVTIDTMRYDHTGIGGYERNTTPNIDALAGECVTFTQVTTPRPKTTPSMATLLTGLYPHNNGVRRLVDRLDAPYVTLAEIFKNAGYETGAVICNYVLNGTATGMAAGFDTYDDTTPEVQGTQRDAKPATEAALSWLADQGDAPVFLWLHYMDPHGPYTPPAPYDTAFQSTERGSWHVSTAEIPVASRLGDEKDVHYYIDQYDGEILYTDHYVGELLAGLDQLGMRENTVLLVTTDHGESLGEHEYYFEHGKYLYDNCSRLPFFLDYPGAPSGKQIDAVVELQDAFPTLLELAGLTPPGTTDGLSLLPLIEGKTKTHRDAAYIERFTMMKGIRTPEWKLIHTYGRDGSVSRRELYDLESDPAEESNLYASASQEATALEQQLLAWTREDVFMAERPGHEGEGEAASAEVLKKLRALGYID